MAAESKCPYKGGSTPTTKPQTIRDWWPDSLDLRILHQDPITAHSFAQLDLHQLRNDIYKALTTSNPNWPADYGHYGPLMIRLAWHSAGTYRVFDGRGGGNSGNIRLAPLNSWPDNANLDKARRYILWPIKQKYGQQISWSDLIVLAGNWEDTTPLWFGGGRIDAFAPEEDVFWGNESEWLKDERHEKRSAEDDSTGLEKPLGAVQMGLIYVNPEGPGGNPDILASAKDIRETFSRMGMSDFETVALIAGGHTFGKAHGSADPSKYVGAEPEGAPVEQMGLGWKNAYGTGKGRDTITSGLEGAWTNKPTQWDNGYFELLFKYDWTQSKSPGGATQWIPRRGSGVADVPDAHDASVKHLPIMFTTDLALRYDPIYGPISQRFHLNPHEFTDAFKRAWYKLCHRDMGPLQRHLGQWLPTEDLIWLDPIPSSNGNTINVNDVSILKSKISDLINSSTLSVSDLVKAAWASASTYRCTDHRGGANGGRIRLNPQKSWDVNDPSSLGKVIVTLESIQQNFNAMNSNQVSFADLVVLGGNVAIEEAARRAGHYNVRVTFVPGRMDAFQSQTDVVSFNALQPMVDGFRNYEGNSSTSALRPEEALIDRAHLLTLSAPETVVLLGGMRVLNANTDNSNIGVLTERPGALTNDFFVHLLDENTNWTSMNDGKLFRGRTSRDKNWIASRVDLLLGSNSQLRAIAESYACTDSTKFFVKDFLSVWSKVMMLDRFDMIPPVVEMNSRL
ncbi:peroxidase/catalase [Thalassiosira pseudonana CCMP1335]|uniref:Catalase-peroxidase n=1 Tax=Thalassiosira pseudonana TaxID=35128 RepID=B8CF21_THAPS|nr:peroxidase/catalase [Thalassiosira pseudonana CCMP1335]EED88002.1 peroxidase/catalase [Thalassiosira pseudonana CCMP1335]